MAIDIEPPTDAEQRQLRAIHVVVRSIEHALRESRAEIATRFGLDELGVGTAIIFAQCISANHAARTAAGLAPKEVSDEELDAAILAAIRETNKGQTHGR